jgi:hypothetical protein
VNEYSFILKAKGKFNQQVFYFKRGNYRKNTNMKQVWSAGIFARNRRLPATGACAPERTR